VALAADQWDLGGAASLEIPVVTTVVYARKSNGAIWKRQINPTTGSWQLYGNPAGGTSSRPQVGLFQGAGCGSQTWVFVRGPYPSDPGNILTSINGGAWQNLFGMPPGGTTSAPSVAWSAEAASITVAVRGANNVPWVRTVNHSGTNCTLNWGNWTQVGTDAIDGPPAVATNGYNISVFATFPGGNIKVNMCMFPTCFGGWTNLGGIGVTGPGAVWYRDNNGNDNLRVTVIGTDNKSWINTLTSNGWTWSGWSQFGNGNSPFTSVPNVAVFGVTNTPYVTALGSDGNYYRQGQNIGHP
jgi:hypothetical protein